MIDIDEQALRREVADALLDDSVVAELQAGAIPGLKAWKRIDMLPSKREQTISAMEANIKGDSINIKSAATASASSSTGGKSPKASEEGRAWVIPRSPVSKLHISTADSQEDASPVWLCCQSARGKFIDAAYRGKGLLEGVTAAKLMNRKLCESCLGHLSEAMVDAVQKQMKS